MAAITPGAGGSLNAVPSPIKSAISTNYLDFTSSDIDGNGNAGWAQQYLPDLIEQEAEVYGKRNISGFLSAIGAEEAMSSDQVVWTEQGRLHLSYKISAVNESTNVITLNGVVGTTNTASFSANGHAVRVGQTVLVSDGQATPVVFRGYVSAVAATTITVLPYTGAAISNITGFALSGTAGRVFVYGSEFKKATNGMGNDAANNPVQPEFKSFNNKPIILKDHYEISGSDTSRIGWVEVSAEDGTSGYLWYLKAEAETRLRFADYLEMALVEAEKTTVSADGSATEITGSLGTASGTEGLFSAITEEVTQLQVSVELAQQMI